eukprot:gene46816-62640_t
MAVGGRQVASCRRPDEHTLVALSPDVPGPGPLVAIGVTIAFGAVLAYCGRVATPTLVARAAPDVAAAPFDATVGEEPVGSIDPSAPASDAPVISSDPLAGTGAGALAATSAAAAGTSPAPTVTVATGVPVVQGSGSSTSSRPS